MNLRYHSPSFPADSPFIYFSKKSDIGDGVGADVDVKRPVRFANIYFIDCLSFYIPVFQLTGPNAFRCRTG